MVGSPLGATAAQRLSARFLGAAQYESARPAFRGKNLEVQSATHREIVLTGPGGTGKSVAILTRLHRNAEQYPGCRQLVVRKTRASLTESALATFEEKGVIPKDHPILFNRGGQRILRRNRTSYDYPNGSTIVTGGMDEATRLFSTDYDAVYWQEVQEGQQEEWESLLRALRNPVLPVRQLLGDCNPSAPTHWLKIRAKTGRLQLWETYHKDNPFLWDEAHGDWTPIGREYVDGLAAMTGVLRDRLFLGLWVAVQGAIYAPYFRRSGSAPNIVCRTGKWCSRSTSGSVTPSRPGYGSSMGTGGWSSRARPTWPAAPSMLTHRPSCARCAVGSTGAWRTRRHPSRSSGSMRSESTASRRSRGLTPSWPGSARPSPGWPTPATAGPGSP